MAAPRKHDSSLRLQPRDVELLRLLLNHFGLLTRRHICELFPGRGIRRTNRRLHKLIAARFISKRLPTTYLMQEIPLYYLGPRAFEALDLDPHDPLLIAKRKQAAHLRERALPHFMLTNAVHIKFLTAEIAYPDYKLLSWVPSDDAIWTMLNDLGFPLRPDAYIEFQKDAISHCVFLELDRSTERAPRLQDRLAAYNDYALSGSFRDHFAAERFRVAFIPPSSRRRDHLLRAMNSYPAGLFFSTSFEEFFSRSLFEEQWKSNATEGLLSLDTPA